MGYTRRELILGLSAASLHAVETRTPVLVELFTAEGCSSCPPADRLLIQLIEQNPIPGAQVIALSEHVDYWNTLGWVDPFSKAFFTERQQRYAQMLKTSGNYTPQMIVDGQREFVGNDPQMAARAISEAAKTPKDPLELMWREELTVRIPNSAQRANVVVVIVENNLTTNVRNGENKNRTLQHSAVVRRWEQLGDVKPAQPFERSLRIKLDSSWKPANVAAVAFAQATKGGAVTAVNRVLHN